MSDAAAKQFDVVVVAKLDRLSRSMKHLLDTLDTLSNSGVAFASATQNIDTTTAAGKLMFNLLGAFAEFEATLISERTKAGLARVRTNGSKSGKKIGGQPVVNPNQVLGLRAQGRTQAQVAEVLGCTTRTINRIERAA